MQAFLVHTADGEDHHVKARSFEAAERKVSALTTSPIRVTIETYCLPGLRILDRQLSGAPMRRGGKLAYRF